MRFLATIERFLERAVERSTVRLFRAPLQPVQIEGRLERALESARLAGPDGPSVPDRYRIVLRPTDLLGLGVAPDELALGLAEAVLAIARRRGYRLAERPRVEVVTSPRVAPGDVVVETAFSRRAEAVRRAERSADRAAQPSTEPTAKPSTERPTEATGVLGPGGPPLRARLVVRTAGRRAQTVPVDGRPIAIGRAPDNDVRIDDPRVSRHHARIVAREGGLVLVDLGSTNGTWVDGLRVSELALGLGDRIDIAGAAELRLEVAESGPTPADAGPR